MEEGSATDDDRLSSLHDSILAQILLSLPVKQCVQTSVLSRRWHRAWASHPDLLHADPSELRWYQETVKLKYRDWTDCEHVSSRVLFAVEHGLRHLCVHPESRSEPSLELTPEATRSIFSCRSLESLRLDVLLSDNFHGKPIELALLPEFAPALLSRLRVLHLGNVCSSPWESLENLISLERVIAHCPALEDLLLQGHFGALDICAPKLRKLNLLYKHHHDNRLELTSATLNNIFRSRSLESLELTNVRIDCWKLPRPLGLLGKLRVLHLAWFSGISGDSIAEIIAKCPVLEELALKRGHVEALNISAPNVKTLILHAYRAVEVRICCPRAEFFNFQPGWDLKYFQGDLPSLVSAQISHDSEDRAVLGQIIGSLRHATYLKFWPLPIEIFTPHLSQEPDEHDLPMFHNMKSLVFTACFHHDSIEALIYLLKRSPNLNFLRIWSKSYCNCIDKKVGWTSRKLPSKCLEHLQRVRICRRIPNRSEFMKFLSWNVMAWDRVVTSI